MKPWIRNTLVASVALLFTATAGVAGLVWRGEQLRHRVVALPAQAPAPALADSAPARERGAYLYASRGCADCHGLDGAGRTFVSDGALKLAGPAIHSGPGSVVARYSAEDWARTIRHGVKPDGRPLMVMPSEDYNRLTDADVAALVAHVRSLPPAGGGAAVLQMPLPMRALYGAGVMRDAAAKIDHALPPQAPVPEGVTVEHGRYVAETCKGCHGPRLEGGRIPGAPPQWPAAARLRAGEGNAMTRYADAADLIQLFRSGRRADGTAVQVMPFEAFSKMSETDVRALHAYLRSL